MDVLLNIVKERGIVKLIYDYKISLEHTEILLKYCKTKTLKNEKLKTNIKWHSLSKSSEELPEDFLIENFKYLKWKLILKNKKITKNFLKRFEDEIDWYWVTLNLENIVSNKIIITDFHTYIHFPDLILNYDFPENILDEYHDFLLKGINDGDFSNFFKTMKIYDKTDNFSEADEYVKDVEREIFSIMLEYLEYFKND